MAVYYAKAGASGANVGTAADPWKDLASFSGLTSGDTVNMAGKFRETLTPVDGVTYQQWSGQDQYIIDGSDVITATWTYDGSEYWVPWTVDPRVVFRDDTKLTKGTVGSLASGEWGWDSANSRIYVKDDPTGHTMEAGKRSYGTAIVTVSWTIKQAVFRRQTYYNAYFNPAAGKTQRLESCDGYDAGAQAFRGGGFAGDVEIVNCNSHDPTYEFYKNTSGPTGNCLISGGSHSGDGNGTYVVLTGGSFTLERFRSSQQLYFSNQSGGTITISDCTVTNSSSYSIYVTGQSGGTCTIDGNEVSGAGSYGIYLASVTGGTLHTTRNKVHGGSSRAINATSIDGTVADVLIAENIIYDTAAGQVVIYTSAPGTKIYRNTVNSQYNPFQSAPDSSSMLIKGNIFRNSTPTAYQYYFATGGTTTGMVLDYNCLITDVGAFRSHWTDGVIYTTLSSWQAATSQDANSISSDPQFEDAANGDFRLKKTSPCINAGIALPEVTQDFDGNPPDSKGADIGAYEYQFSRLSGSPWGPHLSRKQKIRRLHITELP